VPVAILSAALPNLLATGAAFVTAPIGTLAVMLCVLTVVLWAESRPGAARFFRVVPAILLCYFLPAALSGADLIPRASPFYEWVEDYILPTSLALLTLSLDVGGIVRLGPKAGAMFLAGTLGVVLGGPIAMLLWQHWLPPDASRAVSYLAGSWIGGSANGLALKRSLDVSDSAISPLIVVDAAVGYAWMGVLLFLAGRHERIDRWLKADTTEIVALEERMRRLQAGAARAPAMRDLVYVLAFGFSATWLADWGSRWIVGHAILGSFGLALGVFACKAILATTAGVLASFTPIRQLDAAGASRMGTLMLYLLVTCIGARADFGRLWESGYYLALGVTWMLVHAGVMLATARLIRAPFFYLAVGSQANIGGAASAPVVAAAFYPALAPVGVLLAIAGYALGTYAGLICVKLCQAVGQL
jgi:uncharacterized membrane protein